MNIVKFAITKPVTVLVAVILILLFGILGLRQMPYQLSPTVTEPEITVTTVWPGATPYEVEREIVEEQEDALKGVSNLVEMESSCQNNRSQITLRFKVGTDVDTALLRVSNKLDEVPSYPDGVEKPIINASGASTSPVVWMLLKTKEISPRPIQEYRTFFENVVRQYLERVPGVADLLVFGGTEKEMQVTLDPEKLAAHALRVQEVIAVLQGDNTNVSAGTTGIGRRDYRLRTIGEFKTPADITQTVIHARGDNVVRVGDVAEVHFGYADNDAAMMHNGQNGIVCGIKPEPGVNVLDMTNRAEAVVNDLNQGLLADQDVFLDWVYDQRPYINGAIDLVKRNILLGGLLAVLTLLIFLRSVSSTIIVAAAIPISIIGTFVFMNGFGRNLNVISLAGIAFAVGMLVDSAIVVLENIDRHRSMGKSPFESAYHGAREVWGAVLASTLTTVAVFLPVVFIEQEAGQLFKDIAIAVTCAIALSLFVSVLVIPMLAKHFFTWSRRRHDTKKQGLLGTFGSYFVRAMMGLVRLATANWASRLITLTGLTALAIFLAVALFPKLEYLPQGNRYLILNIMIPPPGLSYAEREDIGQQIADMVAPRMGQQDGGETGIEDLFYIGADTLMLFGATATHDQKGRELIPTLRRVVNSFPGIFGVSLQAGIFEQELGGGRSINVDVRGKNLDQVIQAAGALYGSISKTLPGSQIRPQPSLETLYPEIRYIPKQQRLKALGLTVGELGTTLDVFMDGRNIDDFKQEGEKKIDLVLKGKPGIDTPEDLFQSQLVTPTGAVVPISSVSRLERSYGISEIRHLERQRTVTLEVTPPETLALQAGMETISSKAVPQLRQTGLLDGISVDMSGAADKLEQTWDVLKGNFILAIIITYLLMSALFGNFLYPLVIMFTVPLAAAGGFLGLKLVDWFLVPQPLDVLTMLGFIILIGIVVNNAILIVHQSLNNIRLSGMGHLKAVRESVRTRIRPIYMSACTSIFGMLPLVIAPGPGSELYRGLGSVVLGGLALSTILTVFVTPSLLLFFIRMEKIPTITEEKYESP